MKFLFKKYSIFNIQYLYNSLSRFRWIGLFLVVFGIFLDVFLFNFTSDFLIFGLTFLWILSVYHYKFEGRVSIGMALFFLIMCPFLLIFKKEAIAEKAAIWAYVFLVVGVVQLFSEYLRDIKELKD